MSSSGGFPNSHTTSTTTKVTPLIWFDATYVQTRPGFLKAAAVVLNLLGFILASIGTCSSSCPSVTIFNLVAMSAFWVTLILLALYLFHVIEKLHNVPWLLAEFVYCSLYAVLFFLSSLVVVLNGSVFAAAGFFGFVSMAVYGLDAFMKYQAYQAGEIAQGERSTATADMA